MSAQCSASTAEQDPSLTEKLHTLLVNNGFSTKKKNLLSHKVFIVFIYENTVTDLYMTWKEGSPRESNKWVENSILIQIGGFSKIKMV